MNSYAVEILSLVWYDDESLRVWMELLSGAGGFFGETSQGPERGVKAQRSMPGYTVQSLYGFSVGAK